MPKSNEKNPRVAREVIRVGVDTGGTFTDFVFAANGQTRVFKLASTPDDPATAIKAGLEQVANLTKSTIEQLEVVHGTTVGTNALLQRRGACAALITTKGFEDVLVIGRQARPELYNLDAVKPPPIIPDELRFGIRERVSADGTVIEALDQNQLNKLVRGLKDSGVDSVAICLLFSFVNTAHEQRIADALKAAGIPLSISHQILPEYREFERVATTSINAYLQPLMGNYLKRLSKHTTQLRVMQSSGGSISATVAADEPVRTILSGPAGGVVGALRVARAAGFEKFVTFDMGGTSTDVALCERDGVRTTNEATVAGLPVAVPVLDIHTVGAGGGSIARVDEGGSLRVGPESAGADPGPACYGRSLLPTVTDAHLLLGHFAGSGLLGGEFALDSSRSEQAFATLAAEMTKASGREIVVIEAAQGVVAIANANMERALRQITIERGHDTREFALLPFGGAGGLHAVDLARALRMPKVIVPADGGALSALGVLTADVVKNYSRTVMWILDGAIMKRLESTFKQLERDGAAALREEGFGPGKQRHMRSFAMRYQGQSFELEIDAAAKHLANAFNRAHHERYGYAREGAVIEIVSVRVRSIGLVNKLPVHKRRSLSRGTAKAMRRVSINLNGKRTTANVYEREKLEPGQRLRTPAIVTEYSATTLIPEGAKTNVDVLGNLVIDV